MIGKASARIRAVAPDGSSLVFVGDEDGRRRLYLRRWSSPEAVPLPDTEGAGGPFYSKDGASILFIQDNLVKRISATGGAVVPLQSVTPLGVNHGMTVVNDSLLVVAPSSNHHSVVRPTGSTLPVSTTDAPETCGVPVVASGPALVENVRVAPAVVPASLRATTR